MTHFKARNLTALLLVLVLLVSMFSTTALAAEDEHITDFEAESEIIIEEEPTEELPEAEESSEGLPEAEESSEEVPKIEESSEVSDAPTSGTIPGSNIQWELTDDGMLLISGSGGCAAFSSVADQPWAAVREQITSVFFEDPSLLSIYNLAYWFDGCVSLTTAEIPYTTPVIGTRAFYGCVSLTTIMTYYGDSVLTEIGADAFYLPYDSGSTLYIGYLIGYQELRRQEEKEAQYVATALEIYVTGSLNVFNHRTNVDIQNRIVAFDIKELGKQLKKIGMLVVQDQVWNRVTVNREAHKATRYYIDEFHLLLKEEQTAAYSVEIWKRFRKWGGVPTGITQNVKDLLASREVENIFENSDYIYMLNQASGDRQILAKQLNISPHQLSYVTHSGEGEGLLFYGNIILPFVDRFPKDTELYRVMTTKPNEVSGA